MKRIKLILAIATIIAGNVSCNKNDITSENPLNSLSFVIVPDHSDGTIDNVSPVLQEDSSWILSLKFDVKVTPVKYAEELANSGEYNFKATFSPVETKSGIGDAFTISPKKVTYNDGSDTPHLTFDFELEESVAKALFCDYYVVSAVVENQDGSKAVASEFVPLEDGMLSSDDYDYLPYIESYEGYVNITDETVIRYSDRLDTEADNPLLYADGEELDFTPDGKVPYSDVWVSTRTSIRDPWANGNGTIPLSDWMSRIGDQTLLKHMTIPGTHDSATGHLWNNPTIGDSWAMTQTETFTEQLNFGVRCFDIRLYAESLSACHNIVDTGITFDEILEDHIFPFLNRHNTEGVILILKHEDRNTFLAMKSKDKQWRDYLRGINRIAENVKNKKYGYEHILLNPDFNSLKMGDIRGKAIILFRDIVEYENLLENNIILGEYVNQSVAKGGFNTWSGQTAFSRIINIKRHPGIPFLYDVEYNERNEFGYYYVQDIYEYDDWTSKYYPGIEKCFEYSLRDDFFYFNSTSGYRKSNKCGYGENANLLNRHTATYLRKNEGHGVVMMDFAGIISVKVSGLRETWDVYGDDLCTTCVEHNFYGALTGLYTYQTKN